jgi:hypothetical protein
MKIIVKQSKYKASHLSLTNNKQLIERVSGNAGINTKRKIEIATFVIVVTNEIKMHQLNHPKSERFVSKTKKMHNNYACLDLGKMSHANIFVKCLNFYDTESTAFENLLTILKNNTDDDLTHLILPEIKAVHKDWIELFKTADGYLKLELQGIPPIEVDSLRCMLNSKIFVGIEEDHLGYMKIIFDKQFYSGAWLNTTGKICKTNFTDHIIFKYFYYLNFAIKASESSYIISSGNRYYLMGTDENNFFMFKQLDIEYDVNGYPIDFSGLEGDKEKSETVRLLIEMSQGVVSLWQKTGNMEPREAMEFAVRLILDAGQLSLNGICTDSPDINRDFLISLASDNLTDINFKVKSREFIKDFVNSLTDEQLKEENLPALKDMIKLYETKNEPTI